MAIKRILFWLGCLWLIVITTLLLWPAHKLPTVDLFGFITDKVLHAGVYGLLCLLLGLGSASPRLGAVIGLSFFHGVLIEIAQKYLTVNRSFEVWDIAADAVGCLAAYWLVKLIQKNKPL